MELLHVERTSSPQVGMRPIVNEITITAQDGELVAEALWSNYRESVKGFNSLYAAKGVYYSQDVCISADGLLDALTPDAQKRLHFRHVKITCLK
jgi:hypothetical protein